MEVISVAKFTNGERHLVKSIIATLSLKRITDKEIIKNIFEQTNKMISERTLYELRQSIKRESYQWYKTMREGEYEYLHEFKERINEIMDLQKIHHELSENIPGSSIMCTGKLRIEPINTPPDQLEQLKKDLASNRFSPSAIQSKVNK